MVSSTALSLADLVSLAQLCEASLDLTVVGAEGERGRLVLAQGRIVSAETEVGTAAANPSEALQTILEWDVVELLPETLPGDAPGPRKRDSGTYRVPRPTPPGAVRPSLVPSPSTVLEPVAAPTEAQAAPDGETPAAAEAQAPVAEAASSGLDAPLQSLCLSLKNEIPGAMAVGIFGLAEERMLAVASDVPDTHVDHMSTSHTGMFAQFAEFLGGLPRAIGGQMHSVILDLESATFFMTIDERERLVMMLACDTDSGNLGLMRVICARYLERALGLLREER